MSHATPKHRVMDEAFDRSMARDGDDLQSGGPTMASRDRGRDARSFAPQSPRVPLMKLSIRTSAKGRVYLTGLLGMGTVVGFLDEADAAGNQTWSLFLTERTPPRSGSAGKSPDLHAPAAATASKPPAWARR